MLANRFRLKNIAVYYGLSLALMCLFPWAMHVAGDSNLPPQKPLARLIINAIFLNLGIAYTLLITRKTEEIMPKKLWLMFLAIALLLCVVPPVFSGDLYEYLIRGRIFGVYHKNPYAHASIEFPSDKFFSKSVWIHTPENYGPAWALVEWIMPTFFGQSIALACFMQKVMLLGFLTASGFIFFKIALLVAPQKAHTLTQAFILNPNIWSHHLVDGHNDIIMVFWMLLAIYAMLNQSMTMSLAAAAMGALVKFTSLILLAVVGILFLKSLPGKTNKIWDIFKSAVAVLALTVACYAPFWIGRDTLMYFSTFKGWFYTNSVPYAFYSLLHKLGFLISTTQVEKGFMIFFAVNALSALVYLWLRPKVNPVFIFRVALWMFLALYASYAIPFYGHHFSWAMPFLILSQVPLSPLALLLYSMAGVLAYFKRLSFLYIGAWAVYLSALFIFKLKSAEEA